MLVAFDNSVSYGKIKESSVDSILVKYLGQRFTPVTIARRYFEYSWINEGKKTHILKEDSVKTLVKYLNSLKFKQKLRINTNELLLKSTMSPDGKMQFWIEKEYYDIEAQLVLYKKNGEKEIIWISGLYADIGKRRYETSQELMGFITNLFEPIK